MGGRLSLGWQAAIDGGALLAPEPHFSFFLCFHRLLSMSLFLKQDFFLCFHWLPSNPFMPHFLKDQICQESMYDGQHLVKQECQVSDNRYKMKTAESSLKAISAHLCISEAAATSFVIESWVGIEWSPVRCKVKTSQVLRLTCFWKCWKGGKKNSMPLGVMEP